MVVQLIVAEVVLMLPALTPLITGAGVVGPKNSPLVTAPPSAVAVTLIVTSPWIFHTPYTPPLNCEKLRLSRTIPLAVSVITMVCVRTVVSQSS